jgi:hypothetical protein
LKAITDEVCARSGLRLLSDNVRSEYDGVRLVPVVILSFGVKEISVKLPSPRNHDVRILAVFACHERGQIDLHQLIGVSLVLGAPTIGSFGAGGIPLE